MPKVKPSLKEFWKRKLKVVWARVEIFRMGKALSRPREMIGRARQERIV